MIKKLTGFSLMIAAGAGILFSLAGLFLVWLYTPQVASGAEENLTIFLQSVTATEKGLTAVQESIETIKTDALSLKRATQVLAKGIKDSEPMLETIAQMTEEDLPDAIQATQNSLTAASESALLIDNIMNSLSSIPFSPVKAYQPEIPLHTALGQISENLDGLPDSLKTINQSLNESQKNFDAMQTELDQIGESIETINSNLSDAQAVVDQYHQSTLLLEERLKLARSSAAGFVQALAWILTFLLVWFFVVQWGVLFFAVEMLRGIKSLSA